MSRQQCDCQAQIHPLINNCISCGRIVCAIEKEGPCVFCGNPVKRRGEQFTEQEFPDLDSEVAYKTAVFHKEKLLDFNKREIHQTNIIDDQIDYYQIADNIWESSLVREQAVQKILQQQVEIQKAENENIMELDPVTMQFTIAKQREIDNDAFRDSANVFLHEANQRQVNVDNRLNSMDKCKEIYSDLQKELSSNQSKKLPKFQTSCSQVQNDDYFLEFQKEISSLCPAVEKQEGYDQEFYQLSDCGMCLSMHQPWAQLVVEGIKRIEGRMWATTYKGPLWIHAGAKKPTPEEITQVERQYKTLYPNQPMPVRYPTGALIGCVDFIGIQRRQTYEKQIPQKLREEGDTEYKFVFRNPRKLSYPIQMRGANNLFKIEDQVRSIAVNNLERIPTAWAQYLVEESQCDEIKVQQEMPIEQEVIEPEKSASDELKQNIQVNVNVPKKQAQKQEAFVGMNYGWCQLIDGYADQTQLLNMAKYLETKIGKPNKQQKGTHKMTIKYSLIPHNESILQRINQIVDEQVNYTDVVVYYMRGDDRGFTINSTQGIAVLGAPISVTYEQQKLIIDQQRFISISGGDNFKINLTKEPSYGDVLKEIGQEYSYKSWVIIFNK